MALQRRTSRQAAPTTPSTRRWARTPPARPILPHLRSEERAEVGIGTMVVFIATVLVAAIAAGVLINTSQKLQQRSSQTGNEAVQNVASSLIVLGAEARRNSATGDMEQLDIRVGLAAGADPVDITKLIITYSDGQTQANMVYHATTVAADQFIADWLRDSDSSAANAVMTGDDIVLLKLGEAAATPTYDLALPSDTHVDINLQPSSGTQVKFGFTTPDSFTDDKIVEVF